MPTAKKTTPSRKAAPARPFQERVCNLKPSVDTEQDWTYDDQVRAGALAARAALPASVDLREPWWRINDQEDTGSCVGWATADGVVRWHMVQAGKLAKAKMLSPRHVWMSSKETDQFTSPPETFIEEAGTMLKAAMKVARKYGVAMETDLPFHLATKMYLGSENAFYARCAQHRIASFTNLKRDLGHWKTWLATQGPLLVGLLVDESWDNASLHGGRIDDFKPDTVRGGHAVALVGYRTDGRFIVRNSWGTTWGDKGFGYVSPEYVQAAFYEESYGVTL